MSKMLCYIILCVVFVSGVLSTCSGRAVIAINPLNLKALSGSCVLIPCNFRVNGHTFPGQKSATAMWIKNKAETKNAVYNSDKKAKKNYQMKLIGHLSQKNCTTVFYNLTTQHSDKYYFRVKDGQFKATAKCNTINIEVADSPQRPSITVAGEQTERALVTITCSAFTPCPQAPPTLTWDLSQDPPHITDRNSDGTFTTKIQHNITLNHPIDGVQITCSAKYPVNGEYKVANGSVILNVTYAPKNTSVSVSPSCVLSVGKTVNLSCSSTARPSVHQYSWYKSTTQGPVYVYKGQTYSFNLTHNGHYYCVAYNALGNESSPGVSLKIREVSPPAAGLLWKKVVGGLGLLVLICLGVFVWYFVREQKAAKETQRQAYGGTDKVEEDSVLYAAVDMSKLRARLSPDTTEETVYSQVRVTETQAASEDIYATVQK